MPESLLERADEILKEYESGNKKKANKEEKVQLSFSFDEEESKDDLKEKIDKINPLEMTPMEALNYLYDLKMSLKK